jgi:hypothetical protein
MGAYSLSYLEAIWWLAAAFGSLWLLKSTYMQWFLAGVLGWIATSFLANPYLDFIKLKKQVHEEVVLSGQVSNIVKDTPIYSDAEANLRRLGAQLLATQQATAYPLRCYLNFRGYDLAKAGNGLIKLSNSLSQFDEFRTGQKKSVVDGLKLPRDLL